MVKRSPPMPASQQSPAIHTLLSRNQPCQQGANSDRDENRRRGIRRDELNHLLMGVPRGACGSFANLDRVDGTPSRRVKAGVRHLTRAAPGVIAEPAHVIAQIAKGRLVVVRRDAVRWTGSGGCGRHYMHLLFGALRLPGNVSIRHRQFTLPASGESELSLP